MKLFSNDVLNEATNDSAISNFKLSACHDHLPIVKRKIYCARALAAVGAMTAWSPVSDTVLTTSQKWG
jgi:hypothetical protein